MDIARAIEEGIRKINVGGNLKRAYFEALRAASGNVEAYYSPYKVLGSGLQADALVAGRLAVQQVVKEYIRLFSGAGKAGAEKGE